MSGLPALITNRVEGATYNTTDLNRVGEAMLYVAARLRSCGWGIDVTPKTDWTRADWPTDSDMAWYIRQLAKLHQTLALFKTTPTIPKVGEDKNWLTHQEANDIEQILKDLDTLLTSLSKIFIYAGMPWAVAGNEIYVEAIS